MAKQIKKLYRSKKNRMIAGICGGLGEYLNVDPTFVRLIFIALTVFTGFFPGFLAYLIWWAIVPQK